ncbi:MULTISPECIES: (2Fe-2S)-binding protein [unclassified Clostridium]|uniref:(2Fe-2S)-binding protein n=1 Tax=unclassified Clostridium TaxID=2614128 RepID=UPI003217C339
MSENRIVCTCQDVDYNTIKKAIEDGAKTVDDIMEATGAGTVCGGCISEIEEILQELKK